ncbi:MAG: putative rRNA maturation factor [Thermodesulfobacteriota bacterium]|nr:putative rRNA maturation factor [Thermodesulfobacteriota bacterium]
MKEREIRAKVERVLSDLGCHDKELSILFTDDRRMAELNLRYLGRAGPTNVLAFPMSDIHAPAGQTPDIETDLLGDVVISVDTAQEEAEEFGETLEQTVDRLLIHGILHLLGHDHVGAQAQAALMEREEERLRALVEVTKVS